MIMVPSNYYFSNIAIAILAISQFFFCKVIALNLICLVFILLSLKLLLLFVVLFRSNRRDSKKILLLFTIAFKTVKERQHCRNSSKSENIIESNREKKPWTNIQNRYKNEANTKLGATEKSPILISQYWKNFDRVPKVFWCTNNIFTDWTLLIFWNMS